jgi:hypothetical protein
MRQNILLNELVNNIIRLLMIQARLTSQFLFTYSFAFNERNYENSRCGLPLITVILWICVSYYWYGFAKIMG